MLAMLYFLIQVVVTLDLTGHYRSSFMPFLFSYFLFIFYYFFKKSPLSDFVM